jgi:hypothetical protein
MAYVTMQYENRFTWDDNVSYRAYLIIQMILTSIMMVNACDCSGADIYDPDIIYNSDLIRATSGALREATPAPTPRDAYNYYCSSALRSENSYQYAVFAVATATNQFLAACNYFQAGVNIRIARRWCAAYVSGLMCSAVLFLVPLLPAVEGYRVTMRYTCSLLAHLGCIVFEFISNTPSVELDAVMVADSSRRIMKFTTVVLAQSVLAVISPGSIYTPTAYLTCAAILLTAFLFKTLHFDFDHGHKAVGFARAYVPCIPGRYRVVVSKMLWILSQLGLAMGLTVFGTSAELMVLTFVEGKASRAIQEEFDEEARRHFSFWAWMLPASFCWCIMMTVINQSALRGEGRGVRQWRKRWRLGARVVLGFMALALPALSALASKGVLKFFPSQTTDAAHSVLSLTWTVVVIMTAIVCVDAYGRRRKEHHKRSFRRYLFGQSFRPEKDNLPRREYSDDLLLLSHDGARDAAHAANAVTNAKCNTNAKLHKKGGVHGAACKGGAEGGAEGPPGYSTAEYSGVQQSTAGYSTAEYSTAEYSTAAYSTSLAPASECFAWDDGRPRGVLNRSMDSAAKTQEHGGEDGVWLPSQLEEPLVVHVTSE